MQPAHWAWIGFHVFVILMLALDLGVFHKHAHEIKVKEALIWTGVWIALALVFNLGIFFVRGSTPALEFLTGYFIEKSLSIDNLFVFLTIFNAFGVPKLLQHNVLFLGVVGALVMRAAFIFAGIALLEYFHWVLYVFGVFLVITGIKLAVGEKEERDPRDHWLVKFVQRHLPFTSQYHGGKLFVRLDGRRVATPLFLVLLIVEFSDLIFAVDSIPAILAITQDRFIVYTSNVFAILGLRSLYFALAGIMPLFTHLKYGLAGILVFVGAKLGLSGFIQVPITVSLAVIATFLAGSILLSVIKRTPAH